MSSVIQAAAKGERNAMLSLYKANKQKVWSIAYGLLLEQKQAESIAVTVFRDLWREVKLSAITSKEDFTAAAVCKTAEMCGAAILQRNPKAFQLPYNKSFELPAGFEASRKFQEEPEYYLSNLPALQRLIFLLHTVGNWGALRIAKVLQFDSSVVRSALEAEPDTFSQLQHLSGREYYNDYDAILQMFIQWEEDNKLPASADSQILQAIGSLVSPQAERAKRRKISIAVFCAVVCIGLAAVIIRAAKFNEGQEDPEQTAETTQASEAEETETTVDPTAPYDPPKLDSDVTYYAEIEFAEYGTVVIQLDQEAAPVTCANFVDLAEDGFYDFLTVYSITDGSMIQAGNPNLGGATYSSRRIVGEFSENGYENPLSHTAGAVSMVRSGDYDSASSAFSILRTDRTDMDGKYAVFGYVIEGMDVLDDIYNGVIVDEYGNIDEENQPIIDSLYIREEEEEIEEDY